MTPFDSSVEGAIEGSHGGRALVIKTIPTTGLHHSTGRYSHSSKRHESMACATVARALIISIANTTQRN